MQLPVAEDLLKNIEDFTIVIGNVLETESTAENSTVTITRNNLGMLYIHWCSVQYV